MNKSMLKTLGAVAALSAASQVGAFTIDGIFSAGDNYTDVFSVDFVAEKKDGSTDSHTGVLRLGKDDTSGDIFVLYEVPTGIHDLTWGANKSFGWNTDVGYGNIQGSEKVFFLLDGQDVEVKMSDDGNGTGYEIKADGGAALKAASTSLDYNINHAVPDYYNSSLFPNNGDPVFCTDNTSDAACYASSTLPPNYQFAYLYEMQFDGALFDTTADFLSKISGSLVHASPSKNEYKEYKTACINGGTCDTVTEVPQPPMLGLLIAAIAGLGLRRMARK